MSTTTLLILQLYLIALYLVAPTDVGPFHDLLVSVSSILFHRFKILLCSINVAAFYYAAVHLGTTLS